MEQTINATRKKVEGCGRDGLCGRKATVYNIEEAVKGRKSIARGDREDVGLKQRRGSWGEKWRKEKKRG